MLHQRDHPAPARGGRPPSTSAATDLAADEVVLARMESWPAWPTRELRGEERERVLATEPDLQGVVVADGFELVEWLGWRREELNATGDDLGGRYTIVSSGTHTHADDYCYLSRGVESRGTYCRHRSYVRSGQRGWGSRRDWFLKWDHAFREAVRRSGVDMCLET